MNKFVDKDRETKEEDLNDFVDKVRRAEALDLVLKEFIKSNSEIKELIEYLKLKNLDYKSEFIIAADYEERKKKELTWKNYYVSNWLLWVGDRYLSISNLQAPEKELVDGSLKFTDNQYMRYEILKRSGIGLFDHIQDYKDLTLALEGFHKFITKGIRYL